MPPRPRRLVPAAVAVLCALALAAPGASVAASPACDGATGAPAAPGGVAVTLCLINARRADHGLTPLVESAQLDGAAGGYAGVMVDGGFFAHESPGGSTLLSRLRAAGWLPASGSWTAGENIAWGSGSLGSPGKIVDAWMASSGHRANILQPAFTQIGIGIAAGAPGDGISGAAATYVTDFGAKPPVARCARAARSAARRCSRG